VMRLLHRLNKPWGLYPTYLHPKRAEWTAEQAISN